MKLLYAISKLLMYY